jgi:hypothetical protein
MDNPNVMTTRTDSLLMSYSLLVVPTFDVVRVSLVRIMHRKPIFDADKNHIHHKLLRSGLNQHQALLVILLLALFYIAVNVALSQVVADSMIVMIDIIVWIVFHCLVNLAIHKNGESVYQEQKAR